MTGEIRARPKKAHAFATQAHAMPRERRESVRAHDSVARHLRVVAPAHDVPDRARRERSARHHADEAVGRDATGRDAFHDAANGARPRVHGPIMPKRATVILKTRMKG
jgi:hypothetical protein